jgi:hypothetical protein
MQNAASGPSEYRVRITQWQPSSNAGTPALPNVADRRSGSAAARDAALDASLRDDQHATARTMPNADYLGGNRRSCRDGSRPEEHLRRSPPRCGVAPNDGSAPTLVLAASTLIGLAAESRHRTSAHRKRLCTCPNIAGIIPSRRVIERREGVVTEVAHAGRGLVTSALHDGCVHAAPVRCHLPGRLTGSGDFRVRPSRPVIVSRSVLDRRLAGATERLKSPFGRRDAPLPGVKNCSSAPLRGGATSFRFSCPLVHKSGRVMRVC